MNNYSSVQIKNKTKKIFIIESIVGHFYYII